MSKELELLQKILTAYREDKSCMSWGVANEIKELLAQPEQSNEPVVKSLAAELLHNKAWYQKGYGDAKQKLKREPLSDDEICNLYYNVNGAIHKFARVIEKAHGIGVDDE